MHCNSPSQIKSPAHSSLISTPSPAVVGDSLSIDSLRSPIAARPRGKSLNPGLINTMPWCNESPVSIPLLQSGFRRLWAFSLTLSLPHSSADVHLYLQLTFNLRSYHAGHVFTRCHSSSLPGIFFALVPLLNTFDRSASSAAPRLRRGHRSLHSSNSLNTTMSPGLRQIEVSTGIGTSGWLQ